MFRTIHGCGICTSEGRVASYPLDQGAEDRTDANTSTSEANSGKTSTLNFRRSNQSSSRCFSNNASRLHGTTGNAGAQVTADAVEEQTMADGGLTSLTDNRALDASLSWNCIEILDSAQDTSLLCLGFE